MGLPDKSKLMRLIEAEDDNGPSMERETALSTLQRFLDFKVLVSCLIAVTAPTLWLSAAYWELVGEVHANKAQIAEIKMDRDREAERTRTLQLRYERILGKLENIEGRVNEAKFGASTRN